MNPLASVARARLRVEQRREAVRDAERHLSNAVRGAFIAGESAVKIAQTLGVTRARVYQIRDGKR